MNRRSAADAKRDFSELVRAAERGQSTLILRHGKPVALLTSYAEDRTTGPLPHPTRPGGLLSLVGLFTDWPSIDDDMTQIVEARQDASDREPVDLGS